jgi:6-phospho-3-hexuloisomerase
MFTDYADTVLLELRHTLSSISNDKTGRLADMILSAGSVFAAGAGRSGFAVKAFAMRLMHMGLSSHAVGEATTPGISAGDILVIGSGSGATESLVAMAGKAKRAGAKVALLTIAEHSPIADIADIVITIPAPTSKIAQDTGYRSAQPMGSLFEQTLFIAFDIIVMMLMEKTGKDSDTMFKRHANLE